ncbi:MAG: hypothetical protein PHH90_12275 [Limnochordia bacterium]|jgi:hypothetical protein|nr:hypothetical protein [Limnochordia bacterium]
MWRAFLGKSIYRYGGRSLVDESDCNNKRAFDSAHILNRYSETGVSKEIDRVLWKIAASMIVVIHVFPVSIAIFEEAIWYKFTE